MAGSQYHLTPAPLKYEERENSSKCILLVNALFAPVLLDFYWWKIHSGRGLSLRPASDLRWQTITLRLCAIPQQGLVRWLRFLRKPEAARTPLNIPALTVSLGRLCSFGGGVNIVHCRTMHVWRVSSAHRFRACTSWQADTRYLTRFSTWNWLAVSQHAQVQPPPACRRPFQLCLVLQAAYSTYWLTTGLKRATDISKPFSDKTVSNHTGLPQISRQAWWWHWRRYMWMERLGGRKEQLI